LQHNTTFSFGNVALIDKIYSETAFFASVPGGSLLVFDCGGNTQENKRRIRDLNFHHLTLEAKKKGPYRNGIAISHPRKESRVSFVSGNRGHSYVKSRL